MFFYDTENVLRYSLLLDTNPDNGREGHFKKVKKSVDISSWVDDVFDFTHSSCRKFIPKMNGFFMGRDEDEIGLAAMDRKEEFWKFIFKQQSILFSYDMIRKTLAKLNSQSGSAFNQLTLPHGELCNEDQNEDCYGLYRLLTSQNARGQYLATLDNNCALHINSENNLRIYKEDIPDNTPFQIEHLREPLIRGLMGIVRKEADFGESDEETILRLWDNNGKSYFQKILLDYYRKLSSNRANHNAETLLSRLSPSCNLDQITCLPIENVGKESLMQVNVLELYQYSTLYKSNEEGGKKKKSTISAISRYFSPDFSSFGTKSYRSLCREYSTLVRDLYVPGLDAQEQPSDNSSVLKFELADKVHLRYQLEQLFSMEMVDCVYKNLTSHKDREYLTDWLYLVASFSSLPNAFSKHLIMQVALDSMYGLHFTLKRNFGNSNPEAGVFRTGTSEGYTDYQNKVLWKERCSSMLKALNNFLFPVYSNLFLVSAWNSVRGTCSSDEMCLKELFSLFSQYLNDEKNVEKLFSFEKMLNDGGKETQKYVPYIVKPFKDFPSPLCEARIGSKHVKINPGESSNDAKLYFRCLQAVAYTNRNESVPNALLSKEYIQNLYSSLDLDVQRTLYRAAESITSCPFF